MRVQLFKHKQSGWGGGEVPYVSPYLLEILSTRPGAPTWSPGAYASWAANTGQSITNTLAQSRYYRTGPGVTPLAIASPDSVVLEVEGMLRESPAANYCLHSDLTVMGTGADSALGPFGPNITYTVSENAVADPTGGFNSELGKLVFAARPDTEQDWVYALTGAGVNSCQSVYIRSAPGKGTQTIYMERTDSSPTGVQFTVTEAWSRIYCGSAGYIAIGYGTDGGDSQPSVAGATFYIWRPQVEITYVGDATLRAPSSVITTGASTGTRDGDQLVCSNPLAALGSPAQYSFALAAKPLANWGNQGTGGVCIMLASGPNGGANNIRADVQLGGGFNSFYGENVDGSVAKVEWQGLNFTTNPDDSEFSFGWSVDTSGPVVTGIPAGGQAGAGSGALNFAATIMYLGNPQGFQNFAFIGHMHDIVVDNTVIFP